MIRRPYLFLAAVVVTALALAAFGVWPASIDAFAEVAAPTIVNPAPDTTVNFGPLFTIFVSWIVPIVGTIVLAIYGVARYQILKRTGFDIDVATKNIEFLHRDALKTWLERKAGEFLAAHNSILDIKIDVHNADIARLAQTGVNSIPDALKFFGLTQEKLTTMLVGTIGRLTATATVAVEAPPTPLAAPIGGVRKS